MQHILTASLWGSSAQSYAPPLQTARIFQCRHPMMCSQKYPDDFLKFLGFRETMDTINWLGITD